MGVEAVRCLVIYGSGGCTMHHIWEWRLYDASYMGVEAVRCIVVYGSGGWAFKISGDRTRIFERKIFGNMCGLINGSGVWCF
jgi:hypothetical protein